MSVPTGTSFIESFAASIDLAEDGRNYGDIETEGFAKRVVRSVGAPAIR